MQKIHIAALALTVTDWGKQPPDGNRLLWIDLTLADGQVERRIVTLDRTDQVHFIDHQPADLVAMLVSLGLTRPPQLNKKES